MRRVLPVNSGTHSLLLNGATPAERSSGDDAWIWSTGSTRTASTSLFA
jgi:hypothetical protein